MKRLLIRGSFMVGLAALMFAACSELKKDLVAPVTGGAQVHPSSWIDTTSSDFHGKELLTKRTTLVTCAKCHAASYGGGTSGVSCFKCHSLYPHMTGWVDTLSATFHGDFLKAGGFHLQACTECHGADFSGGTSNVSCYTCHDAYPHTESWMDTMSTGFHGVFLKNTSPSAWDVQQCSPCHGGTFTGGPAGVACFPCHSAFPHSAAFASIRHTGYMRTNGYPLMQCQKCHGVSYTGGPVVDVSCEQSGCHVDANGTPKSPEACNTCHGIFRAPATGNPATWAPPRDVYGDTATTFPGVGAHQEHFGPDFSNPVQCQECHTVPSGVYDAGHIGSQPYAASLTWGPLASLATGSGQYTPTPSYDRTLHSCNSTFCHGAWRLVKGGRPGYEYIYGPTDTVMGGENFAPVWTGGPSQEQCGSCHGIPPRGHLPFAITQCAACHGTVIDATGKIIDPTKHINGKVDIFNEEYSF